MKKQSLMYSVAVGGALAAAAMVALPATSTWAWQSPTKHRYLSKPLQLCDEGTFFVGGAPKITPFHIGPTPGEPREIIIGHMYVQFQIPMVSKSWPLIMVHGSGYTGTCVEGTAGGNEGWKQYAVRHGVPTYVVDQAGRGRSGFDHTVIHEAEYLIDSNPAGAKALLPTIGGHWGSKAWSDLTYPPLLGHWFGTIQPQGTDITSGTMVRKGAPGDPLCATEPLHCSQLGRLAMEPEAPWGVDQAIKSRTGKGAPAGLGTVLPDTPMVLANASNLALEAYKFDVPNMETTLPGGTCPNCTNPNLPSTSIWTPKALAELVEGLGGAIVATHSQSGIMGHDMVRYLKADGKLDMLKGLITIEGSCGLAAAGITAADFRNIPYLAFKGDYTDPRQECRDAVTAINAAGGHAENIELDQPGWWQGSYAGGYGANYVGPFAGVSHMMMIEDKPAANGKATNLQVMDVLLEWADRNISKPATQACSENIDDDDDHVPPGQDDDRVPPGLAKKPGGLPPGQAKKKG
jgi:hypothetical protein